MEESKPTWRKKLRNLFFGSQEVKEIEVPESWGGKKKPENLELHEPEELETRGGWKYRPRLRVPLLRRANKVIAGFMFIFNFAIAISSAYTTQGAEGVFIFFAFLLNAYFSLRVVWDRRT